MADVATQAANWWDFEKPAGAKGTHAAGDDGEDLNTPNDTPVSFPVSGRILNASYHNFGGEVVLVPDAGQSIQGFDPYWIHLDQEYVTAGQHVDAGQPVGTTGGGVGDLVLHNGTVQPAQDQSWYDGHSDGYHSEFGAFQDTSATGDITQFDQGWGHASRQLDPRPVLDTLRAGEGSGSPGILFGQTFSKTTASSSNGIVNINFPSPSTWITGALGIKAVPKHIASRSVAGIAGMGLVWLGLLVSASGELKGKTEQALDKLGPVAAVAEPAIGAANALRGTKVTPAPERTPPARQVSPPKPAPKVSPPAAKPPAQLAAPVKTGVTKVKEAGDRFVQFFARDRRKERDDVKAKRAEGYKGIDATLDALRKKPEGGPKS